MAACGAVEINRGVFLFFGRSTFVVRFPVESQEAEHNRNVHEHGHTHEYTHSHDTDPLTSFLFSFPGNQRMPFLCNLNGFLYFVSLRQAFCRQCEARSSAAHQMRLKDLQMNASSEEAKVRHVVSLSTRVPSVFFPVELFRPFQIATDAVVLVKISNFPSSKSDWSTIGLSTSRNPDNRQASKLS